MMQRTPPARSTRALFAPALAIFLLGPLACGGEAVVDQASGGAGGAGVPSSCDEIAAAYGATLNEAKGCALAVSKLQCTEQVKSALNCGCPTYVNPDNAEATKRLAELDAAWQAGGCILPQPCPSGCPAPQSGWCEPDAPDGDTAHCVDVF